MVTEKRRQQNAQAQREWRKRQKEKLAQAEQAKPYYDKPETPEQQAVNLYGKGSDSLRKLDLAMHALASHIRQMANGTRDNPYPLWRKLQYRDTTIQPESFERYLLDKPRNGLGIPSLAWLYDHLRNDHKTLETLRSAIPDFDQKAAKTRASDQDKAEIARLREALNAGNAEIARLSDERDALKLELSRLRQDQEPTEAKPKRTRKTKPA